MSLLGRENVGETHSTIFYTIYMNDIPIVEDLVQVNIFFYNMDIMGGGNEWRARQEKCWHTSDSLTLTIQQPPLPFFFFQCSPRSFSSLSMRWIQQIASELERHEQHARNEITSSCPTTCIQSMKYCMTKSSCLVYFKQTKTPLQHFGQFWVWINLCGKWGFPRSRNNNMQCEAHLKTRQLATKTVFRDNGIRYQSLGSTMPGMISTLSRVTYDRSF